VAYVRAAAADPWLEAAREGVVAALAASPGGADVAGQTPLAHAREFVVLAFADELIDEPELVQRYVEGMSDAAGVTLAIDASELDPAVAVERLAPVLHGARAADHEDVDMLALVGSLDAVGRARLAVGADAVYSRSATRGPARPRFGPDTLDALRRLCLDSASCGTLAAK
jgi:hypothetical protein